MVGKSSQFLLLWQQKKHYGHKTATSITVQTRLDGRVGLVYPFADTNKPCPCLDTTQFLEAKTWRGSEKKSANMIHNEYV